MTTTGHLIKPEVASSPFSLKVDRLNSTDAGIKFGDSELLTELDPPVRSSSINSSMIINSTSLLDNTGLVEEQKDATMTPSFNSPVIQAIPKDKIHQAAKHLWPISQSNNIEMINQAFANQKLMFFIAKLIRDYPQEWTQGEYITVVWHTLIKITKLFQQGNIYHFKQKWTLFKNLYNVASGVYSNDLQKVTELQSIAEIAKKAKERYLENE